MDWKTYSSSLKRSNFKLNVAILNELEMGNITFMCKSCLNFMSWLCVSLKFCIL